MTTTNRICDHCEMSLDRVGPEGCDFGHVQPNLAQRIARKIEDDLNDRRGFKLNTLDDETRNSIVDKWEVLIQTELDKHGIRK